MVVRIPYAPFYSHLVECSFSDDHALNDQSSYYQGLDQSLCYQG